MPNGLLLGTAVLLIVEQVFWEVYDYEAHGPFGDALQMLLIF